MSNFTYSNSLDFISRWMGFFSCVIAYSFDSDH